MARGLAFIALAVFAGASFAQQTNGCGSGIERFVVPDRLKIIGCDFRRSCDQHDLCYGACSSYQKRNKPPQCEYLRCQTGGDLVGSQACDSVKFRKLRKAAEERRAICDSNFMLNIVKNNPGNSRCTLFSALYPFAVRALGARSFVGIDALQTSWPEEEKDAYALAINQLFETWSDSQIDRLAKQLKSGESKIDLTKPIRFDKAVGLVNLQ